jgi:uncharacterized protein (TIGR02266 family)
MSGPEDKRKHKRIDIIFKVDYESGEDFLADHASNASGGGLFIATCKPFEVGDQLSFSISLPGLLDPLLCRGEVRWRRSPETASPDDPAGIGVRFLFETEEEASRIQGLMERLSAESGEPGAAPEAAPGLRPFRVLLAEDNRVVRDMFLFAVQKFHGVKMAGQRELEVVEAENGKEALDQLQNERFDLLIIDYYMPVLDGMQVIRRVREGGIALSGLPIIVISAGGEEAQQAAYQAGADFFLNKPVMLTQLFSTLQRLLSLEEQL